MPIRNQIEAVVNQLVIKPNFLYGTARELNVLADDVEFPIVMLYSLKPIEKDTTLSNAIDEKFAIYLEFLFKTEFDQYTSDNETYIEQANNLCNEFLVKLQNYRESPNASRYFKIHQDEKMRSLPVYNRLDANSTGVNLTLTLKTMNNDGYDPNSRPVGYIA